MSKFIRPILIGLVVAFVVALLLRGLYGPASSAPVLYGVGSGVIAAYLLANLAGNRSVPTATSDQKARALVAQPPPDKALLYLYREGFVAKLAGLNVAVDGREVAQLKSPQFTCVTVAPGTHIVSAAFGGLAGPQNAPSQVTIDAPAGSVAALRLTMKMGAVRNAVDITPQADLPKAMLALARMAMIEAEVGDTPA